MSDCTSIPCIYNFSATHLAERLWLLKPAGLMRRRSIRSILKATGLASRRPALPPLFLPPFLIRSLCVSASLRPFSVGASSEAFTHIDQPTITFLCVTCLFAPPPCVQARGAGCCAPSGQTVIRFEWGTSLYRLLPGG